MAGPESPAARTSLYRLVGVPDLRAGVQNKYLERGEFTDLSTVVSEREALLVFGAMTTHTVAWAATLHALTSYPVDLGNTTAAAALLIRNGEEDAWALTYGMGFQLLNQAKVDAGFGQRIAIRVADPRELNSLTRTTLDQRSRTDRFSIPSGDHLRGFGVGDFGELVTRLVAKAEIPSITGGTKPIRIRGADALSIPLGRKPHTLLDDLDALESILATNAAPGLEVLEQLVAIKHNLDLIDTLEEALADALTDPDHARLGLSWPHERIDENGTPSSFRLTGAGRRLAHVQDGTPDLSTLLAVLADETEPLDRLHRLKIQLYRDDAGDEPISAAIPGVRWLAFETDRDRQRYCLHDGSWYLMDQAYAEKLKTQTEAIFARGPHIELPEWPKGYDEAAYNALAADALGGTLLDRRLIYTELHHRGIEVCDVLDPAGVLVHVKSIESSAPASHLLAQALVSTDALLHDEEARTTFRQRIEETGGDPGRIPTPIHTVVLALAHKGRPVTSGDLFSFTQVTLVRNVTQLQGRGVNVFVAPITRPE